MHTKRAFLAWMLALVGLIVAGCSSGEGPLLVNTSGSTVRLVVHSAGTAPFEGSLEDQAAVWAGKSGATVTRIEIHGLAVEHVLEGEALDTRYGKDRASAFIIEATGPRKLTLAEARLLMRHR